MTKIKMYRYLGRNGILTTRVLLDGINHIVVYNLTADEGKILTNGEVELKSITVEEDEVVSWNEITDRTV